MPVSSAKASILGGEEPLASKGTMWALAVRCTHVCGVCRYNIYKKIMKIIVLYMRQRCHQLKIHHTKIKKCPLPVVQSVSTRCLPGRTPHWHRSRVPDRCRSLSTERRWRDTR